MHLYKKQKAQLKPKKDKEKNSRDSDCIFHSHASYREDKSKIINHYSKFKDFSSNIKDIESLLNYESHDPSDLREKYRKIDINYFNSRNKSNISIHKSKQANQTIIEKLINKSYQKKDLTAIPLKKIFSNKNEQRLNNDVERFAVLTRKVEYSQNLRIWKKQRKSDKYFESNTLKNSIIKIQNLWRAFSHRQFRKSPKIIKIQSIWRGFIYRTIRYSKMKSLLLFFKFEYKLKIQSFKIVFSNLVLKYAKIYKMNFLTQKVNIITFAYKKRLERKRNIVKRIFISVKKYLLSKIFSHGFHMIFRYEKIKFYARYIERSYLSYKARVKLHNKIQMSFKVFINPLLIIYLKNRKVINSRYFKKKKFFLEFVVKKWKIILQKIRFRKFYETFYRIVLHHFYNANFYRFKNNLLLHKLKKLKLNMIMRNFFNLTVIVKKNYYRLVLKKWKGMIWVKKTQKYFANNLIRSILSVYLKNLLKEIFSPKHMQITFYFDKMKLKLINLGLKNLFLYFKLNNTIKIKCRSVFKFVRLNQLRINFKRLKNNTISNQLKACNIICSTKNHTFNHLKNRSITPSPCFLLSLIIKLSFLKIKFSIFNKIKYFSLMKDRIIQTTLVVMVKKLKVYLKCKNEKYFSKWSEINKRAKRSPAFVALKYCLKIIDDAQKRISNIKKEDIFFTLKKYIELKDRFFGKFDSLKKIFAIFNILCVKFYKIEVENKILFLKTLCKIKILTYFRIKMLSRINRNQIKLKLLLKSKILQFKRQTLKKVLCTSSNIIKNEIKLKSRQASKYIPYFFLLLYKKFILIELNSYSVNTSKQGISNVNKFIKSYATRRYIKELVKRILYQSILTRLIEINKKYKTGITENNFDIWRLHSNMSCYLIKEYKYIKETLREYIISLRIKLLAFRLIKFNACFDKTK